MDRLVVGITVVLLATMATIGVVLSPADSRSKADAPHSGTSPQLVWVDQPGHSWLRGVAAGRDGAIYTVGKTNHFRLGQVYTEAFIRAYSPKGAVLWTREFGQPGSAVATAVDLAPDGTVVVAGDSWPGGDDESDDPPRDGWLRVYSRAGELLWTSPMRRDRAVRTTAVVAHPSGIVLTAGNIEEAVDGEWKGFVRAQRPDGAIWTRRLEFESSVSAMTVDPDGGVHIAGGGEGNDDAFVRTYSPTGEVVWTDVFGTDSFELARGVAALRDGSLVVVGSVDGHFPGQPVTPHRDGFVRMYSPTREVEWHDQLSGQHGADATSVAVDDDDLVHVAGGIVVEPEYEDRVFVEAVSDVLLRSYTASGTPLWTDQYGTDGDERYARIAAGAPSEVAVVGVTDGAFPGFANQRSTSFVMRLALPSCEGRTATMVGTSGDDLLIGTAGPDVIVAGDGNDMIQGRNGDDVICAGPGDDAVWAGDGDDTIHGQAGRDRLRGGDGNDFLAGGSGNDITVGNNGRDTLRAGLGADRVNGGFGNDRLRGGDGPDRLIGSSGADELDGGRGNDRIVAGSGDDALRGSAGNDVLQGRDGDDDLDGSIGRDRCNGGAGTNTFTDCELIL